MIGVSTPQVRLFDPHFGGVIAKGTLLPLNSTVLPPGTLVLRASQVKAPDAALFWSKWTAYWNQALVWAHQVHQQQQQRWQQQQQHLVGVGNTPGACSQAAAAVAAAAAATTACRRSALEYVHPQDRPWLQQLWYVHEAWQKAVVCSSSSSSGGGSSSISSINDCCDQPPTPCKPWQPPQQQQQSGSSGYSAACSRTDGSSSRLLCSCSASLEVVCRPPDGCERGGEKLRVNKNLLLLLHHAGVPQAVFTE
jgi:hypothetical protein